MGKRFIETVHVHLLHGWRRRMKSEGAERTHFRYQSQEERLYPGKDTWLFINVSPLFALPGLRNVVDKLLSRLAGIAVFDLVFFQMPSHLGRSWNQFRYSVSISANGEIDAPKNRCQFDRVSLEECPFQERLGNLKANEVMVGARRVVAFGHLVYIKGKLHTQVHGGIV